MPPFEHVEHEAVSDVGRKRKNNEDAWLSLPLHGVFCVADGMGGADEGEVASGAIVDALTRAFQGFDETVLSLESKVRMVRRAADEASAWITARAKRRGSGGSGSTFVAVVLDAARPEHAAALHAGDSRLYQFRGGALRSITRDHSVAALEGLTNEEDLAPMFRSMITRAVGVAESVKLERTEFDVAAGDCLFLCSDGLTRMVNDDGLRGLLQAMAGAPAKVQAQRLVDEANTAGGKDNVTVNFLRIGPLPEPVAVVGAGADGDERETADEAGPKPDSDTDRSTAGSEEKATPDGAMPPEAGDVLVGKTPSSGNELEVDAAPAAQPVAAPAPSPSPVPPAPVARPQVSPASPAVPAAPPARTGRPRAVLLALLAVVALAAAAVWVLPMLRPAAEEPSACQVRIEPGTLGAGERVAVSIREQGATAWTAIGPETTALKRMTFDVRWERVDYEPQQSAVSFVADRVTLSPPEAWTPKPALAKLIELEAHAAAGRWQPVEDYLSRSGSAGVLESQLHRDRWAALRSAWQRSRPAAAAVVSNPPPAVAPPVVVPTATVAVVAPPVVVPPVVAPPVVVTTAAPPIRLPTVAVVRVRLALPPWRPDGAAPVSAFFRAGTEAPWVPLSFGTGTNLPPGPLEVRFTREGYDDAVTRLVLREAPVAAEVPALAQWQPSASLQGLLAAEKAVAEGKWGEAARWAGARGLRDGLTWQGYRARDAQIEAAVQRHEEEQKAAQRNRGQVRALLHARVVAARTNGNWHAALACLRDAGDRPEDAVDAADLAAVRVWQSWRGELVRLGGPAVAGKAYAEVLGRASASLGVPACAPAPAAPAAAQGDDEALASLCSRVQAWRLQCAAPALREVGDVARKACLATEPAARGAWSNYWGFVMRDPVRSEFLAALDGARCAAVADAAEAAGESLARFASVPPTPRELEQIFPEPGPAADLASCLKPWLLVAQHAEGLTHGLKMLSADSLTGIHRERLPAECAEVDRCLARVAQLEAALQAVPGDDAGRTAWLLRGGWSRVLDLAQDVDRLKQSVEALKAAVKARRQRH